jgi:curved DNA-binding protein CbpA
MPLTFAPKLAELEALSDEELRRAYDEAAGNTAIGLDWYREELSRRRYERDAEAMRRLTERTVALTERTVHLTWVNAAVAILALVVAVVSLWR